MDERPWWCEIDIRIVHSDLDPFALTQLLQIEPSFAQLPGESKVPHGKCLSAGYWCVSHRVEYPDRPDIAITWAESFIRSHELEIQKLLNKEADVNIYLGIHSSVMAVGFVFPTIRTIERLNLQLGIEYFS